MATSARTKHLRALGLTDDADEATTKKAFRKLALMYHPDRNPTNVEEATERFKQINEAHTYLTSAAGRVRTPPKTQPAPARPPPPTTPEPSRWPPQPTQPEPGPTRSPPRPRPSPAAAGRARTPPTTQPEPARSPQRPRPDRPHRPPAEKPAKPNEPEGADLRRAAEARRQAQEREARRQAAAARKREADDGAAQAEAGARLRASTYAQTEAALREEDRRFEQRKEAIHAAQTKEAAAQSTRPPPPLRSTNRSTKVAAAKVEIMLMDWPSQLMAWCRSTLYHYGYFKRIYHKNKKVRPLRATFESLGLKEDDVARLHEQFLLIDKDSSGSIELWEMLDHLDLKRNRFAKRVFAIFDVDGSNEIDFREFVVALWQYCTLGRPQLVMFAFDLYDRDSSGAIDFDEFNAMLKELYGKRYAKNSTAVNLLRHINQLTKKHDTDEVDVEAFAEFCRTHPAMLVPAFSMQQTLRERILGGAWWDRRSNERVKVNGHNMRIHDLLKSHLSEGAFHSFMEAVDSHDTRELKRDAERHRDFGVDWKATASITGTVAQRRRKQGQLDLQDRPLDKYSSSKARRRVRSHDDVRKVRPDQNAALQRASLDANPRGRASREGFGSRLSAAVASHKKKEGKELLGALDGLPRKVGEAGLLRVVSARRRTSFS